MPNKYSHDSDLTQEEWDKCQAPLIKVDPIVKEFAQKYGFRFKNTWNHDWTRRELRCVKKSKKEEYDLAMIIILDAKKEKKYVYTYPLWVGVFSEYKLELKRIIFTILRKRMATREWFSWTKNLEEFKETIDPERLKQLLEEAKQILDNFDESWLKEMKRVNGIGSFVGQMEK